MRTIQEIFDAVIAAGRYKPLTEELCSESANYPPEDDWRMYAPFDEYMCNSLKIAAIHGEISDDESEHAQTIIADYLNGWSTLDYSLEVQRMPFEFGDRLKIYQNWDARPKIMSFNEYLNKLEPVYTNY